MTASAGLGLKYSAPPDIGTPAISTTTSSTLSSAHAASAADRLLSPVVPQRQAVDFKEPGKAFLYLRQTAVHGLRPSGESSSARLDFEARHKDDNR